jgi:hypothetical protein
MPDQQPQLTPEQQVEQNMKQNTPDLWNRVRINQRMPEYTQMEVKRLAAQSQVTKIEEDMAPNSPFRQQLWTQAENQTNQDYPGMSGQKDWLDQRQKNFDALINPVVQSQRGIWQSQTGAMESYQKELLEMSKPKEMSDEEGKELMGYKAGMNKIDTMTNNYAQLLKDSPQLGNAATGQWAAQLKSFANDPGIRSYLQTSPLMQAFYAKGVASESGKLSNQEMDLASHALPMPGDSMATAQGKANLLKQFLQTEYNTNLRGFQDLGKNTVNFQPIDMNKPGTYATQPRTDMGTGQPQTADPLQNPLVSKPSAQATPAPTPNLLPDYAQKGLSDINNWLLGNAKQNVQTQTAGAQNTQQQQAAAAQQAQQQAAAAQQAQQQAGAQAAQQRPSMSD